MPVDIFGMFAGFKEQFFTSVKLFLPLFGLGIAAILIALLIRNRKLYRFPVSIISEREEGGTKERETKGAIIYRKGSSPYFVFKIGLLKKKMLPKLPRLYGMTGYDRLYFYQKDPDTFIQLKRKISELVVDLEPVESDVKYGAILSIQRIRELTQKQSIWQKYGTHILLLMGMCIILIMFILMLEKFDPGLMLAISEKMQATAEALARAK